MWTVNHAEGTAVGQSLPIAVDGALVATLTALWDDEDGVRVSIDWNTGDALTVAQAGALADGLRQVADMPAPD